MATVRLMTPDDIDAVSDLTARVFGDPEDYQTTASILKSAYRECPFMPPDLCWVGEDAGRIVVKWQILDLEMLVAGVPIRMGGIQAVAAEPDANHKGYAKKVALAALPKHPPIHNHLTHTSIPPSLIPPPYLAYPLRA